MNDCPVCGGNVIPTHRGLLLGHHNVGYFMCSNCEFLCTEDPYWLDEAYSEGVAATDTGLVQRNLYLARQLGAVLPRLFPDGPYVDWAGGCGLFVRLMRDQGFPFYWQDRYSENVLAKGFDWATRGDVGKASVVTAFEVLEHVPDPLEFFRQVLGETGARSIFFTEVLHAGTHVDPEWFYFAPVTGQHISFYSAKTLRTIAQRLGMHLHSRGMLHFMTSNPVNVRRYRYAMAVARTVGLMAGVQRRVLRTPASLTNADQDELTERYLSKSELPD